MNSKTKKTKLISASKVMRKLRLIPLIVISLLFMGCPKSSKFSLVDKPILKIDQRLVGTWEVATPELKDNYYVTEVKISKSSATEYQLIVTKWIDAPYQYEPSTQTFRAYLADFSGGNWLIVNNEEGGSNYFFLIKSISNNELSISELGSPGHLRGIELKINEEEEGFRKFVSDYAVFEENIRWVKQ